MALTAVWLKIDEKNIIQALQAAGKKLDVVDAEISLDFSCVRRIDPKGLAAIEEFLDLANGKDVDVVLRGVDVGVYKVLKLVKLASRFSFAN